MVQIVIVRSDYDWLLSSVTIRTIVPSERRVDEHLKITHFGYVVSFVIENKQIFVVFSLTLVQPTKNKTNHSDFDAILVNSR